MDAAPPTTARASAATRTLPESDMVLLRALVWLRWAGVAATVAVLVLSGDEVDRAGIAYASATAAAAWTAATTVAVRRDAELLVGWPAILIELAIAAALQAADGWALGAERTWGTPALGGLWCLAAPMAAGVIRGPWVGSAVGAALVAGRLVGTLAPDVVRGFSFRLADLSPDRGPRLVPTLSLGVLYVVAGAGAAYLADRQRRAEAELATATAREELAQGLHDGVLQALVAIGRRDDEPAAARLAREAERDLRRYLFGQATTAAAGLEEALADVARDFARVSDVTPEVVVDPETSPLDAQKTAAVAGAVSEALANVGKHAGATRVVVYAGPAGDGRGVFISVKDDGVGFDPDAAHDGRGLDGSIRSRIAAVGGRVEVRSRLGQGSEVRMWLR